MSKPPAVRTAAGGRAARRGGGGGAAGGASRRHPGLVLPGRPVPARRRRAPAASEFPFENLRHASNCGFLFVLALRVVELPGRPFPARCQLAQLQVGDGSNKKALQASTTVPWFLHRRPLDSHKLGAPEGRAPVLTGQPRRTYSMGSTCPVGSGGPGAHSHSVTRYICIAPGRHEW